jgi:hypothetical protein
VVPLVVADETGRPLTADRPHDGRTIVRLVRAPASGIATLTCAPRYSTTEMLNTESRLLALGRARLKGACGIADAVRLEAVLAERGDLFFEQAAMVRSLCSSGNGVEVVVGVPGSGKTFALDAARRAWQSSGYRVYGAALAAEAAAQLEAGSQISSVTLDRLVYELAAPQHLSHYSLDRRSIVVVDEASMVDTRRLVRLLEIAERAGAKVVLTGDDRQRVRSRRAAALARWAASSVRPGLAQMPARCPSGSAPRSMRFARAVPVRQPRPTPITAGSVARPTRPN